MLNNCLFYELINCISFLIFNNLIMCPFLYNMNAYAMKFPNSFLKITFKYINHFWELENFQKRIECVIM